MKYSKINGYAIIRKTWGGKKYEVIGVGRDTCEAWNDAGNNENNGRVPTRDLYIEFPDWKCVPAVIKVAFEIGEVAA